MFSVGTHDGHSCHAPDPCDAGEHQRFLADGDAVADRLALGQHVVEIARVRIDHDGAGRFLAVEVDDVAQIRLGNGRLLIGHVGQQLAVARRQIRVGRRLDGLLHAAGDQHRQGQSGEQGESPLNPAPFSPQFPCRSSHRSFDSHR
jgi:hypothetical protein